MLSQDLGALKVLSAVSQAQILKDQTQKTITAQLELANRKQSQISTQTDAIGKPTHLNFTE